MPDRPPIRNLWAAWVVDVVERMTRTFAQGFVAAVSLDAISSHVNLSLVSQLELGALAGGYAIVTSLAALRTGNVKSSASLLPKSTTLLVDELQARPEGLERSVELLGAFRRDRQRSLG